MAHANREQLPLVDSREQLLALLDDPDVQVKIRQITQQDNTVTHSVPEPKIVIQEVEKIVEVEKVVEVEKIVEVEKPVEVFVDRIVEKIIEVEKPDPLRLSLTRELEILAAVNRDADIQKLWLSGAEYTEGQQLIQLTARAAQWDEVLQLWDLLANRCKQAQRPATSDELQILAAAVAIHNRIWSGRQAQLQSATTERFDYEIHERVGLKGDHISEECLPGLVNAAGKLLKKCLVKTR